MKGLQRGRKGWRWWSAGAMVLSLLLIGPAIELPAEDCQVAEEHGGMRFPVARLDAGTRCLIGDVVNRYTTSGLIGPVQSPITQELYVYLLDRPVMLALLVQRLELGAYQVAEKAQHQFWVNDGEGTQGLFTLLYQDQVNRIYHITGYHEGQLFPMVRAKVVVFMRIQAVVTQGGQPAVETALRVYTRLNDPILAGLVRILSPLLGDAVTRTLAKGFTVINQLGSRIAQDPGRVTQEVASLSSIESDQRQRFTALLKALSRPTAQRQPARPASP
jgi:hypothetical protein